MSRILVFDQAGNSLGEIHGNCKRGWAINGGGSATVNLARSEAINPWLQIGCLLYVEHPNLPAWAGVVDTPWKATMPVQLTAYDISYLMHLRSSESPLTIRGTTGIIAAKLIELTNYLGDMRIRAGRIDAEDFSRDEKFEVKTYWEMLLDLVKRNQYEMVARSEIDADRKLTAYLDINPVAGEDVPLVLADGQGGNMQITAANVDGEIWNRVQAMTDESTFTSRSKSLVEDADSISDYGLRNTTKTFAGIHSQTALDEAAKNSMGDLKTPNISITANILDINAAFKWIRPGNRVHVRATRLVLPGGRQGWTGIMRINSMSFDEAKHQVGVGMTGEL